MHVKLISDSQHRLVVRNLVKNDKIMINDDDECITSHVRPDDRSSVNLKEKQTETDTHSGAKMVPRNYD